jgi:hypothetical protein
MENQELDGDLSEDSGDEASEESYPVDIPAPVQNDMPDEIETLCVDKESGITNDNDESRGQECVPCGGTFPSEQVATVPCSHEFYTGCLGELSQTSTRDSNDVPSVVG